MSHANKLSDECECPHCRGDLSLWTPRAEYDRIFAQLNETRAKLAAATYLIAKWLRSTFHHPV